LVDSAWVIDPSINKGVLRIGADTSKHKFAVLTVIDDKKRILAEAAPEISQLYSDQIPGKWVRLQEPIVQSDPRAFLADLLRRDETLIKGKTPFATGSFIIGVIFPEEVKWRECKDGWVFLFAQRRKAR
jgi:hypothetical protein